MWNPPCLLQGVSKCQEEAPQLLATTGLLSVFLNWLIINISYKWNYAIWGLWYLPFFTEYNDFKVNRCCSIYRYFTPFYNSLVIHSKCISYFVYWSVNWWTFEFFPFLLLWIILLWTFMCKCLHGYVIYLEVKLLSHIVVTICYALRKHPAKLFSKMPLPFYVLKNSMREF